MGNEKPTKQEIAENSSGIQAQGNITIDNSGIKSDILLPTLINIGRDISEAKAIINEVREQQRSDNLKIHLQNLVGKMNEINEEEEEEEKNIFKKVPSNNVKKTKLIEEWVDEVSNIDPNEAVLSKIWQRWILELNMKGNITNLSKLLEIMKKLTPAHAELLLEIKQRRGYLQKEAKNIYSIRHSYLKDLKDLDVVTFSQRVSPSGILFGSIILFFSISTYLILSGYLAILVTNGISNFLSDVFLSGGTSIISILLTAFIIFTFIASFQRKRKVLDIFIETNYTLTEIGEQIVSFANKGPDS
ncbi:MAG: hypothetical protein JNK81_06920 [Anaerolineales bacterium]|nr:hypothetical protein [Anaerolineales bacterium]